MESAEKLRSSNLNGQKFYGSVNNIEADGFEIVEVDSKQTAGFKYIELKKINKGDGEKNLITGKRANPQKGWLYGAAIFGTLLVILAIGLSDKDF